MSPSQRSRVLRLTLYIVVMLLAAWFVHRRYVALPPAPAPVVTPVLPEAKR
jgi:hypothetical protein